MPPPKSPAKPQVATHDEKPQSHYEQAQDDECDVLSSIYMDDYESIETKTAWSKKAERSFKLRLRSSTDPEVSVLLAATLTATYPKSLPILKLESSQNVREKALENVKHILASKPKEFAGEVMIHEIATAIQDVLEDDVQLAAQGKQVPSLEAERAIAEAAAEKQARAKEEETVRRQKEEKAEEDRMLQQMMNEEVKRREELRKKQRALKSDDASPLTPVEADIAFDQSVRLEKPGNDSVSFSGLNIVSHLAKGPLTDVYIGTPAVAQPQRSSKASLPILAVKRVTLADCHAKALILSLESELERLKKLRHPNIVNVYAIKVDISKTECHFDILVDYEAQGCLRNILDLSGSINTRRARKIAIELCEALDYYHKHGIVHGRLHAGNILLSAMPGGDFTSKLGDAGFQNTLYNLHGQSQTDSKSKSWLYSLWEPPEMSRNGGQKQGNFFPSTRKIDIWSFGCILMQMLFGLDIIENFDGPSRFLTSTDVSDPLEDLCRDVFNASPNKRPSAFDLIATEFLRTDAPAIAISLQSTGKHSSTLSGVDNPRNLKQRRESLVHQPSNSRYANEWDESARLGRGGFGEVVKARNKLDGRIYAIKKITQKTPAELTQVLSEGRLLATLNHPYVVRYYTAWPEEEIVSSAEDSEITSTYTGPDDSSLDFGPSTGGLDFVSSSGYPKIEFGRDSGDDDDDDDDEDEEAVSSASDDDEDADPSTNNKGAGGSVSPPSLKLQKSRSSSRAVKSTLYIQMEFCERLTLRDAIRRVLGVDEVWRLLRQVLEGLAHIHSHGIAHRDLKPDNIFLDAADNPKIGDFGLATTGQSHFHADKVEGSRATDGDVTRSVGTALYVAPEMKSGSSGQYTDKVDMYSLGIILFEMCQPFKTAMERIQSISQIRQADHQLPSAFQEPEKVLQGDVIQSLVRHRPSERPNSAELLRSGKLPIQVEDETIRVALQGLSDPNSPYYLKMMSALFSQSSGRELKQELWEMSSQTMKLEADRMLLQNLVKEKLTDCFLRHGAVEASRQTLFPKSDYYDENVVKLLDSSGTLVQLPYDLTLPHARSIARQVPAVRKTFTFGLVYREATIDGAPWVSLEADLDIASPTSKNPALEEAEIVKTMDEIIDEFPESALGNICFHVSHSELLDLILEFVRIPPAQRTRTKDILGKLHIHDHSWQKIRGELRAPSIGISSTSLDELAQFDFRAPPAKCFSRLQFIFKNSTFLPKLHKIFIHISGLAEYVKRMGLKRPFYCSPLSNFNDKFYQGGVMFQCLFDGKKRYVLAAGGRYDSLVSAHQPRFSTSNSSRGYSHAVGIKIAWERLIAKMTSYQKHANSAYLKKAEDQGTVNRWFPRRCDCLVACFDASTLHSVGVKMVSELWAHDISAELAAEADSQEELLSRHRDDRYSFIIIIRGEALSSGKADLRVKNMEGKEDADVESRDLLSYLRTELRERDQREAGSNASSQVRTRVGRHASNMSEGGGAASGPKEYPVQVLTAMHRSKKYNKWRAIEAAQTAASELAATFFDGAPIASVETRDEVLDAIHRTTRLSDGESWRKVIQDVPLQERAYVSDIHNMLKVFKDDAQYAGVGRCFIYNFRTGKCVDYDLRL